MDDNILLERFTRRTLEAMRNKGWNQSHLAREAEISRVHISFVLRGKRMPSISVALRIARALDLTLNDLVESDLVD